MNSISSYIHFFNNSDVGRLRFCRIKIGWLKKNVVLLRNDFKYFLLPPTFINLVKAWFSNKKYPVTNQTNSISYWKPKFNRSFKGYWWIKSVLVQLKRRKYQFFQYKINFEISHQTPTKSKGYFLVKIPIFKRYF